MSLLSSVKKVIAVASGKGGVGKSTLAVNLAVVLQQKSYQVGLLDADIYGPSLPQLMGISLTEPIQRNISQKFIPKIAYNIPTMSIAYFIDSNAPAIWRGPMASTAVQQLLRDTDWGNLDYLIIDLPPGTGDIHLTLAQKLPLDGVIIITTPQSLALSDVRKAIAMFQKVQVPLLGIVENMNQYQCPHCHHETKLFGEGGAIQLTEDFHLPLLGCLPFDKHIGEQSEKGEPLPTIQPNHAVSQSYQKIAQHLLEQLKKTTCRQFQEIIVEK